VKVVVDFDECASNAVCMGILPEVFEVRDDGYLYVLNENPPEEFRERLREAVNGCPTGTFIGGWWMCTDYRGHQLCEGTGVRYYIDCNAIPGHPFPGGCRCAGGTCANRRQNCNVFRYGQCNTHIKGTTPVVCRVVACENPGTIAGLGCSSAKMVDDAVCGHEAACLEPVAVQLPGTGGA